MIKAYSQRLLPPYSGQAQIAESDRARAITVNGEDWEIHFLYATSERSRSDVPGQDYSFRRVAYLRQADLDIIKTRVDNGEQEIDDRIIELIRYLVAASLPFPAADKYEYWLLDPCDDTPLALIFSCNDAEQMNNFPDRPEWNALPAAAMPVEKTDEERERSDPPVNYQVENMVNRRAGNKPRARWFNREREEAVKFPSFMIREDWQDESEVVLCRRYIDRLSTRLLMLHGLSQEERLRMERAARAHPFEVARYFRLYPDVADETTMNAIRVEARLRDAERQGEEGSVLNRRDGIHYI